MNKAEKLYQKIQPKLKRFDWTVVKVPEAYLSGEFGMEHEERIGANYRRFIYWLIKTVKPWQVVELGTHEGRTTAVMLAAGAKNIVTIDNQRYPALLVDDPCCKVLLGDDTDLKMYEGIDLKATDLWFIDTEHTKEQLEKEFNTFQPFFKPGAIILIDDIGKNDDDRYFSSHLYWDKIPYDKVNVDFLHVGFGFGIIVT